MKKTMTMEFLMTDNFDNDIWKCIETGVIYKDLSLTHINKPELYSCGNEIDGDPCYPLDISNIELIFKEREPQPTPEEKFNYMMLSRLKSDCDYYLGNGNRYKGCLWAGDEREQINEMKELYNNFKEDAKPEWLTYEQILEYERLMVIL